MSSWFSSATPTNASSTAPQFHFGSDSDLNLTKSRFEMGSLMASCPIAEKETPATNLYSTKIITAKIGPDLNDTYFVHSGVLLRYKKLASKIQWDTLALPDLEPSVFELVLSFLYSGNYGFADSKGSSLNATQRLQLHSILYCFASRYQIDGLIGLTIQNIRNVKEVSYLDLVDTARVIYPLLSEHDELYRDFFVEQTKKAMMEDINLTQEPRVLNLFGEEKGHLTRDLFVAVSSCVRPVETLTPATSDPGSPPCEPQDVLLETHKAQEPWADYLTCCYDRDQMEVIGKALGAALLTDIWRFFRWDISFSSNMDTKLFDPAIKDMKEAGGATSRVLKEVTVNLLKRVSKDVGSDIESGRCPDRDRHLIPKDGEWPWESCTTCMQERDVFATKVRDWVSSKGCTREDGVACHPWAYNPDSLIQKSGDPTKGIEGSELAPAEGSLTEPAEPSVLPTFDPDTEKQWSEGDSSSDGEYEYEEESEGDSEFWSDEEEGSSDDEEEEAQKAPPSEKKATEDQPQTAEQQVKDTPATSTEQQSSSGVGLKRKDSS